MRFFFVFFLPFVFFHHAQPPLLMSFCDWKTSAPGVQTLTVITVQRDALCSFDFIMEEMLADTDPQTLFAHQTDEADLDVEPIGFTFLLLFFSYIAVVFVIVFFLIYFPPVRSTGTCSPICCCCNVAEETPLPIINIIILFLAIILFLVLFFLSLFFLSLFIFFLHVDKRTW